MCGYRWPRPDIGWPSSAASPMAVPIPTPRSPTSLKPPTPRSAVSPASATRRGSAKHRPTGCAHRWRWAATPPSGRSEPEVPRSDQSCLVRAQAQGTAADAKAQLRRAALLFGLLPRRPLHRLLFRPRFGNAAAVDLDLAAIAVERADAAHLAGDAL